jgi:anti-sigma B factor antagonist
MNDHEQISVDIHSDYVVVHLRGQFTGGEETDTMQRVITFDHVDGSLHVILELSAVTYVNSSFMSALLASQSNVSRRGGSLVMCHVPESLQRIFTVTRLSNVFRTFLTVDEAARSFTTEH